MKNVMTVIKKELYKVFSDKRKTFFSVIFPGLMIYVMYSTIVNVQLDEMTQLDNQISQVVVVDAPINFELSNQFEVIHKEGNFNDYENMVYNNEIELVIGFAADDFSEVVSDKKGDYQISFYYNPTSQTSREARENLLVELNMLNDQILTTRHQGENVLRAFDVAEKQTGDMRKLVTAGLASLSFLLIFFMFSGAQTHGIESLVKEKEQKTISSVLITPIKRLEFIVGKLIAVFILGLLNFVSSITGMILAFSKILFAPSSSSEALMTVGELAMIIGVLLSLMILFVSVIMLLSLISKTQKDTGIYTTAIYLAIFIAGFTTMSESFVIPSQLYYYLIPVYNGLLAVKSILTFEYSSVSIIVTIASSLLLSGLCIGSMVILAKKENIIYS